MKSRLKPENKFLSAPFGFHSQLEGALHSAFEEHRHLNETLTNTMKEAEDLKKLTHSLVEKNNSLALEKV